MGLLITGVIVFFAVHLIPASPLRAQLYEKLGEGGYKGLFSVGALVGLILIVLGFRQAAFTPLWAPLPFGRDLAIMLMPVAAILVVSSNMPNNIKRFLRHPMLIGIGLWGVIHLMANGDLSSTVIFAAFLTFSVLNIALVEMAGRGKSHEPVSAIWDLGTIIVGLFLYAVLYGFHHHFAGVKLY